MSEGILIRVCVEVRMKRVSISMPNGLCEKAHNLGVNISRTATIAVERSVVIIEKELNEGGYPVAKLATPNNHSQRRAQ